MVTRFYDPDFFLNGLLKTQIAHTVRSQCLSNLKLTRLLVLFMGFSYYFFTSIIDYDVEKMFDDILGYIYLVWVFNTLYREEFRYRIRKPLILCVIIRHGEWDKNEKSISLP